MMLLPLQQVMAYSLCDKQTFPKATSIECKVAETSSIIKSNQTVMFKVQGYIQIIDGCSFRSNLSFSGSESPFWYGGNTGNNTAVRLSTDTVNSTGLQSFSLISNAGSWVSYTDFNEFRLYDETYAVIVARCPIMTEKSALSTKNVAQRCGGLLSMPLALLLMIKILG
jgi:hypothetical protein